MTEFLSWASIESVKAIKKISEKDGVKEEEIEMANKGIIEKSNDFIGLHFPSVGAGFGVVFMIIILALVLLCCGRKCWVWSSTPRRRRRERSPVRTELEMRPRGQYVAPYQPMIMPFQPMAIDQERSTPFRSREMEHFFRMLNQQLERSGRQVAWDAEHGTGNNGGMGRGMMDEKSTSENGTQYEWPERFEEIGEIP